MCDDALDSVITEAVFESVSGPFNAANIQNALEELLKTPKMVNTIMSFVQKSINSSIRNLRKELKESHEQEIEKLESENFVLKQKTMLWKIW